MNELEKIIKRVNENGDFYEDNIPTPLLTLDEFFSGNDVIGSIGCNLLSEPHPSDFKKLFKSMVSRNDVSNIFVQITEMDDPDWPFSDTVWVVTTASVDDISKCFPDDLAPDEVWKGWIEGVKYESVGIPEGYNVIACWWD